MSLSEGPLINTIFLGARVIGIQSSAGWQEQISTLKIDLVEDDKFRDHFIKPEPGTPLRFTFHGFQFDGIVQNWGKGRSSSGDPIYNVTLYSPVEILEAVQVVLDSFRGVNLICPNLLNVFGYLEGEDPDSFGGSGKNESGIAWYKIKHGIEDVQTGLTPFGTGIQYKGHTYLVDLSNIPTVPDFYRIGGGAFLSLNQIIRTVFEDSGYDYLVQLKLGAGTGPHIISFKSRSRLTQQPLGQIAAFVEGKDNIVSYEEGSELRNDITSGILLGGEQEVCLGIEDPGDFSTIKQFWGYQQSALLVPFGVEGNQPIVEVVLDDDDNELILLNAASIVDIVGGSEGDPTYQCSIMELRMALVDFDSWSCFVSRKRPDIAEKLGLESFPSIFEKTDFEPILESFYSSDVADVGAFTNKFSYDEIEERIAEIPMKKLQRLYDFVRSSATEFYGKKFIVRIPFFLKAYFEEETNKLLYNMSINSDGYFPDYIGGINSGPLGLNYENFNRFSNDTGKFTPFLRYSGPEVINADLSSFDPQDIIIQGDDIYMRCDIDSDVIFTPGAAALCTINQPLFLLPSDPTGGLFDIADLFDVEPEKIIDVLTSTNGEFPIKISPPCIYPKGIAICLRSHELTYGPWAKIGVPGKIKIEQNDGLVPWNYGGFEIMRIAAEAQLADIGSASQIEESGSVTFAGAPDISLGDQLNGAGPVVTSIDVSVGIQGVTTSYRMRSQTPTFGTFSKQNAERLRRIGTTTQNIRRSFRALADRGRAAQIVGNRARLAFFQNTSRAFQAEQNSNVLQSFIYTDEATGFSTVQTSFQSFAGSVGTSNAHNEEKFQKTAAMGIEGLVRPFSTNLMAQGIPHLIDKNVSKDLNPFKPGNDLRWAASGQQYKGYYTGRNNDVNDMRVMGLRGPLIIVGWGKNFKGEQLPSGDDPLKKFSKWMAGPLNLRWNKFQGTWEAPAVLFGTYRGSNMVRLDGSEEEAPSLDAEGLPILDENGEFVMETYYTEVEIEPFYSVTLAVGKQCVIGYNPIKAIWSLISAAC